MNATWVARSPHRQYAAGYWVRHWSSAAVAIDPFPASVFETSCARVVMQGAHMILHRNWNRCVYQQSCIRHDSI
jgi:hypothetical protein